jgi:hypothetical protein
VPFFEWALGGVRIGLPGSSGSVAFRTLAPAVIAALLVANRQSKLDDWEAFSAQEDRHLFGFYLLATLTAAEVVIFGSQLILNDFDSAVVVSRSYVMGVSLALISGYWISWRSTWVLPLASYFPLTYFQVDGRGRSRWWDWPGQPPFAFLAWALVIATLGIGLAMLGLSRRRIARVETLLRQSSSNLSDTVKESGSE